MTHTHTTRATNPPKQPKQVVGARGGHKHLGGLEVWQTIGKEVGVPGSVLDRARRLKDTYDRSLAGFEEWWADEHEARGRRRAFGGYLQEQRARVPPAVAVVGLKENGGVKPPAAPVEMVVVDDDDEEMYSSKQQEGAAAATEWAEMETDADQNGGGVL